MYTVGNTQMSLLVSSKVCSRSKNLVSVAAVCVLLSLLICGHALHETEEAYCPKNKDASMKKPEGIPRESMESCPETLTRNPVGKSFTKDGQERKRPVINVAIVVCRDRSEMALTFLKSLLLTSRHVIRVHVIAEEEQRQVISSVVANWEATKNKFIEFEFFHLYFPESVNAREWKNLGRPCATQRLFFPELLKETESIIYMDIDMILLKPVEELWDHFHRFTSAHVAALSFEHYFSEGWYPARAQHPFYEPYGLNAGVMLMNLTRMRDLNWIEDVVKIQKEFRNKIPWGDQDILNIYFHRHREKLLTLSCLWNYRPDHCLYIGTDRTDVCTEALHEGVSILHGNKETFRTHKHPEFKSFYEAFKNYNFVGDFKQYVVEYITREFKAFGGEKRELYCTRIAEATLRAFSQSTVSASENEH